MPVSYKYTQGFLKSCTFITSQFGEADDKN